MTATVEINTVNICRDRIPGLSRVNSFDALRRDMDQANIELLKQTYESVDDIDLYVGLLLERPTDPTALVSVHFILANTNFEQKNL